MAKVFDNQLQLDIFQARTGDLGDTFNEEKAKIFKAEFLLLNSTKKPHILNLQYLRIGVNTILCLSEKLKNYKVSLILQIGNLKTKFGR